MRERERNKDSLLDGEKSERKKKFTPNFRDSKCECGRHRKLKGREEKYVKKLREGNSE